MRKILCFGLLLAVLMMAFACKPDCIKETCDAVDAGTDTQLADNGELPDKDENTATLTLTIPKDVFTTEYTQPTLTKPEDFDFGDYLPFVRYEVDVYGEVGTPLYEYAILGEDTLDESHAVWTRLNEKYLTKTELDGDKIIIYRRLSDSEAIKRFATESRVVYISEDAETVGVFRLIDTGIRTSDTVADYDIWNGEYEIFENGASVGRYTYEPLSVDSYQDGDLFDYSNASYTPPRETEYKTSFYSAQATDVHTDPDILVLQAYGEKKRYYFYSLSENRMLLDVEVGFELDFYNRLEINQLIGNRFLVVSFVCAPNGTLLFERDTYMYDVVTGERIRLLDYNYEPLVSPDRKYVAWVGTSYEHYGVNNTVREEYGVTGGVYVRRLDTGETVWYGTGNESYPEYCDVISWIDRSALREVLK